jgi:hypothetical protein
MTVFSLLLPSLTDYLVIECQLEPLFPSNESISTASYSVHFISIACIFLRSYSLRSCSTNLSSISSEQSESKSSVCYLFLDGDKDGWEFRERYKSLSSGMDLRRARKKA